MGCPCIYPFVLNAESRHPVRPERSGAESKGRPSTSLHSTSVALRFAQDARGRGRVNLSPLTSVCFNTNMTNHIPLILTAALSALTILACAGPEPSTIAPSTPAVDPTSTPLPGDPDPLAALQPAAVCKVLTRQNLEPYERLLAPTGNADELMEFGWPHRGRPPFRLEPPIDWEHLASVDRSWNYQLNAWSPVHSILTEHTRSSQPRYLSFALAFAADWIAKNPYSSAETDSDVEDFGWYDMAVGLRVYQIGVHAGRRMSRRFRIRPRGFDSSGNRCSTTSTTSQTTTTSSFTPTTACIKCPDSSPPPPASRISLQSPNTGSRRSNASSESSTSSSAPKAYTSNTPPAISTSSPS